MNRPKISASPIEAIAVSRKSEVVAVHCDAFSDYPTMRFLLGSVASDYGDHLAALIASFLDSTYSKRGVVFGVSVDGELVAAADVVHSSAVPPPEFLRRRAALWGVLGTEAQARYEAYSEVTRGFTPAQPHYYLSMLGIRRRFAGRGLARPLLERVQALSLADRTSTGVALETEDRRNVGFYEHFGYRQVGHERVADGVESWGFFRPD